MKIIWIRINKPLVRPSPSPAGPLGEGGEGRNWHSVVPTEGEEHVEKYHGDVDENNKREKWI